jgi:hypothetical protein
MNKKIRYGVVGLGHIAQTAVLPAFKHAENSELAALVTGNPEKDRELSERYRVRAYGYEGALEKERSTPFTLLRPIFSTANIPARRPGGRWVNGKQWRKALRGNRGNDQRHHAVPARTNGDIYMQFWLRYQT